MCENACERDISEIEFRIVDILVYTRGVVKDRCRSEGWGKFSRAPRAPRRRQQRRVGV